VSPGPGTTGATFGHSRGIMANTDRADASNLDRAMEPRSLYIHVPFCLRRCSYCDFAVEATREPPVAEWLAAVAREAALVADGEGWAEPLSLETLYVGGGTPSLLGPGAMELLRETLRPFAEIAKGAEWTCEANPESFTTEVARGWHAAGVNRISLGVQTFDPGALRWMGRLHGPDGPVRAAAAAREAGFEDISVDLIFGLPERLGRDWMADLERVVSLGPEHVSLYGLTAEVGTPLGRWVREGRETLVGEDGYAEEYLLAHRVLTGAGFDHYEVSNFSRPGRHSRHNFVYWTGAPYAALGPGAHGYLAGKRRWNLRSWSAYREALRDGRLPVEGMEEIDASTLGLEAAWLGLRTRRGYELDLATRDGRRLIERWVGGGLARLEGGAVRLTPEGWLLLDRLAVDLHAANEGRDRPRRRAIDARRPPVQIGANSNLSSG
jgi:oxygen-independent coproporphyrinogen III oxidase